MKENKKIMIEEKLQDVKEGKIIDLSHEILSVSDYEWLSNIIKQSGYLETILLPDISRYDAEKILSILDEATITNSTLTKINITESNFQFSKEVITYNKIQSRLNRNKKRIFGIHGGGNIGLGLMADIVSKCPVAYHIIATSNNQFNSSLVNSVSRLWLQHSSPCQDEATCVTNINMISRESTDIIRLYMESCLVAICLTPAVMPSVAKDIAKALIKRYEIDGGGLTILVLMNIPNPVQFVLEKITHEIGLITQNTCLTEKILAGIRFIPTVIDRIVTPIPDRVIKSQLKSQLEKIDSSELMLHLNNTDIESIIACNETLIKAVSVFKLRFHLFNAEKQFSMHVANEFIEADQFPLIAKTQDLTILETVKNKYINGPHAVLAWLGALLGYSTIAESIKHPVLFHFIKEMMEHEIAPILIAEYPDLTKDDLTQLETSFFERCAVSIDDTVIRVGRDPMRKLDSGGRIRGTIELAQKHNLDISTSRLEQGIAAGFLYALKGIDPSNPGCQKIRDIYKTNNNSFYSLLCYSGEAPSGKFLGLHPENDRSLISNVLYKMTTFNQWQDNSNQSKTSSTALILSRVSFGKKAKPLSEALFTKADCSLADVASKSMSFKGNIDSHTNTVQPIKNNGAIKINKSFALK